MALSEESGVGTTMLVSPTNGMPYPYPVYGGGGNSGNNGFGDGNGWWIILLIILLAAGGWNNNGNSGGSFGGSPIIVNDGNNSVQRGFDQAAIMGGINGINSSVQGISTQLCNCCGDMQMAVANGFSNAEMSANSRQMANMNQSFTNQMAMMQGFNNLQSQFAECLKKIFNKAKKIFGFTNFETVGTYA